MGGQSLAALAAERGTPLYVYDAGRVRGNLERLRQALRQEGLRHRVFYAMKSNRFVPLLSRMCGWDVGIDACSPAELRLARSAGFAGGAICFTSHSMSDDDWDAVLRTPGLLIQCDGVEQVRSVGERAPGSQIGLRVDTGIGIGYRENPLLQYSGGQVSKFGLDAGQVPEALEVAARHGLRVRGLHCHAGCGYLDAMLPRLREILHAIAGMAGKLGRLDYLNIGGGLGIPLSAADAPLDLDSWAGVVRECLGPLGTEVWVEPGDYLVKDAGVLLLRVTYVQEKAGRLFAGLDGGFNLPPEPVFYNLPCEPLPVVPREGEVRPVTLAGNINEAGDLWMREHPLPPLRKGDLVALINAGGYGASMSSNHCLRGSFSELLIDQP